MFVHQNLGKSNLNKVLYFKVLSCIIFHNSDSRTDSCRKSADMLFNFDPSLDAILKPFM